MGNQSVILEVSEGNGAAVEPVCVSGQRALTMQRGEDLKSAMPKAVLAPSLGAALEMRAASRDTWLILPKDPVRDDEAIRLSFEDVFREAALIARGGRRVIEDS